MTRTNVLLGGVIAVALVILAWLFLISPQNDELAQVRADTEAQNAQAVAVQSQIVGLEQVRADAPRLEAEIAEIDSIVPSDPSLASTLRQLQAAADDAGVQLLTVVPTRPSKMAEAQPATIHEMDIAINLEGSYFQTVDFLRRIEDPSITARGLEVTTVSVSKNPETYPTLTVALSARAYAVLDEPPVVVEEAPPTPAATDSEAGVGDDGQSDDQQDAPASDEGEGQS